MSMNKIIITIAIVFQVYFGAAPNLYAFDKIIESTPAKAVVSTDNSCLLSETVNFDLNQNIAIKLPPDTDIKSIKMISDGNEIKNKRIEKKTRIETVNVEQSYNGNVVITKKENEIIECYLVSVEPKFNIKGGFKLEYIVSGISWEPSLAANITEDHVILSFNALVNNSSVNLNNTEIDLVASPAEYTSKTSKKTYRHGRDESQQRPDAYSPIQRKALSKSDQVVYKVGKLTIGNDKKTSMLINIKTANITALNHTYVWQTDDEFVRDIISVKNPFQFTVCDTGNIIIHNETIIDNYLTGWSYPNDDMVLYEDTEKNIVCTSSVEVVEDLVKKIRYKNNRDRKPGDELYYNHSYEFSCINNSDNDKIVNLVFKKKYGRNSKTIYHFEQDPTSSPSWWHIWKVKMGKHLSYLLKFNLDSDVDTFKEYKKYKKALEGC